MQDSKQKEPKGTYLRVVDYIKQEIRRGSLTIGSCLPPERTLAEQLNVSRNSVREAIRMLEIMGVVVSTQGAGHFISCNFEGSLVESMSFLFSLQGLKFTEISQLRRALEMQALTLAIENADQDELQVLEAIDARLDRGNLSEEENVALDKKLHYEIARASGNTLIFHILEALSEVMDRFVADLRQDIMSDPERSDKLTRAHRQMVAAIKEKNLQLGLSALEDHFSLVDSRLQARTDRTEHHP